MAETVYPNPAQLACYYRLLDRLFSDSPAPAPPLSVDRTLPPGEAITPARTTPKPRRASAPPAPPDDAREGQK
jgi:hypothetical protein